MSNHIPNKYLFALIISIPLSETDEDKTEAADGGM